MVKISAVIITYNEEKNVGKCIDSVRQVADEIIVVDSYSRDRTREICLKKGVRFLEHPFRNHTDQKNFAVGLASYDHILSLDADEYLSEELEQSILLVKESWTNEAFRMNRLSNYGGKWIRHGSWYPDRKIRLWNRTFGQWGGENPHEKVILKRGVRVIQLRGDLRHRAYRDASETLVKIQHYSDLFARENVGIKSGSVSKIFFRSAFAFVKSYFLKRGFLDGYEGLMVAMAVANHVYYKYSKLYVANKQRSIGKRVIITRTDNLGDVILTLPLLGFLKAEVPGIEITFIGKQYTKAILDRCVFVDHFLDREEVVRNPALLSAIQADSIIFVYPDRELALLAKKSGIRNRVGSSHRIYHWLYCNRLVNFSRLRSSLHESQLNFKLLSPFKLVHDIDLDEMFPYYGMKSSAKTVDIPQDPERFNLIIHPKSKGSAREWGLQHFDLLIQSLPPQEFRIFISGLKEEGDLIRREAPGLFEHEHVTDLTGKLSLDKMISCIQQADGLLACSTGVLHIASALGKYALGLYAPMRPIHPGRWKPLGPHASYLVLNKHCEACRKSQDCECIRSITVEQVKARLMDFAGELKKSKALHSTIPETR